MIYLQMYLIFIACLDCLALMSQGQMQVYGSSPDLATQLRNLTNEAGRLREGITYDYGKVSCYWWRSRQGEL